MSDIMPLDRIDDWQHRLARQDAFWDGQIIDRPVVNIHWHEQQVDLPTAPADLRQRWLDPQYRAEVALAQVRNTHYAGDALPFAFPNLGPEVFSAYYGQEMEYGERTSWSIPCLDDCADADHLQFSTDNHFWQQTLAMTDAMLEIGRGHFYTGLTDLHPGGDAIAAFRDPQELCCDILDDPEAIIALRERIDEDFCRIFDLFCDRLEAADQAFSTWPGIVSSKRWHVPSNDFSCMISEQHFRDIFLAGLIKECEHSEANIYHLDGPDALRHLDALLEIESLNAIQWVFGAGNGRWCDWIPVYQKIQAAGKGIQVCGIKPDEIELLCTELQPEGCWLGVQDIHDEDSAQALCKRLSAWTGTTQLAMS